MKRHFVVVTAFLLMVGRLVPAFSATIDTGSVEFIRSLGNQALQVIRSDMAPTQKLTFFHELLNQDFDMPEISRFVLGPYWRSATDAERQEFVQLLSDDLVRFYSRRFTQYHGETLRVTGSRSDPAGMIVASQIIRPDGPPIEVDWQLSVERGVYKIGDVVIDGVSMALSERATFAQQIQLGGGQVAGLLSRMQEQARGNAPPGPYDPAPVPALPVR